MSFFAELKRRNVVRVAIAYALFAWVVLQILDVVVGVINAPPWVLQLSFFIAVLGLFAVTVVSWVYEITPEGIKRESEVDRSRSITTQTGRKLDRLIIGLLTVAVAVLLADKFLGTSLVPGSPDTAADPGTEPGDSIVVATPDDRSLAVLPFVAMSSGEDDEYFADGLTEEILNSLAQLPELLVTARTSAFSFKGQDISVSEIAETLGVKHIVEGSVRRSGDRLRVTAQLIRAEDGFHLWSDTYDSTSQDAIAVQENIAEQIAVSLDVVLDDSKRRAMQLAGLRNVEAFTLYQKARYWYTAAHGEINTYEGLRAANALLEEVIELVPDFPQAYVDHSDLYAHIVLDDLAGVPTPGLTQEDLDSARELAIQDFDMAIRHAKSEHERHSYEFDRAFLAGQWQGITGRLEQVLNHDGCINNNWASQWSDIFGFAEAHAEFAREIRLCDPLVSIEWFVEARSLFWAGRLEESLAVAQEGTEVAPGSWLDLQAVYTLTALGRFEEADRVIVTRIQDPGSADLGRMVIAGSRGDRAALDRHFQNTQAAGGSRLSSFVYYVWSGQQELANQIAAQLDQSPNHHFALSVFTTWCACGAPFDLAYTPNFAAKLESAGLHWPPPPTIEFPLQIRQ